MQLAPTLQGPSPVHALRAIQVMPTDSMVAWLPTHLRIKVSAAVHITKSFLQQILLTNDTLGKHKKAMNLGLIAGVAAGGLYSK